jgi:hypothetical protein
MYNAESIIRARSIGIQKRWGELKKYPWQLTQKSGTCGFTSILYANLFTYGPEALWPLLKAIYYDNEGKITKKINNRIGFFGRFSNEHLRLDNFLTLGFMLLFKERYGKSMLNMKNFKGNLIHGSDEKTIYQDCVDYSLCFNKYLEKRGSSCRYKENPFGENEKLHNVMTMQKKAHKLQDDMLSTKAGDLALSFEGLKFCLGNDLLPHNCEGMYHFTSEKNPMLPNKGPDYGRCEIWGLGTRDSSVIPELNPYYNILHWIFVPCVENNSNLDELEIWNWGLIPERFIDLYKREGYIRRLRIVLIYRKKILHENNIEMNKNNYKILSSTNKPKGLGY